MNDVQSIRQLVGNTPLILVRPSIILVNAVGGILLVRYADDSWGIPGGLLELGESVEQCAMREVMEEIGLAIRELKLVGVYSGESLHTKLANGHEYYNVVIAYLCAAYEGILKPDGVEVLEAQFFHPYDLPEKTVPFLRDRIEEHASMFINLAHAST
jgi:8-oxo-dGTP pyrophosphatase MutT (NUDIX family)